MMLIKSFRSSNSYLNPVKATEKLFRLASTFKAAVVRSPLEPLVIEELDPVKLQKDQVRIQVEYCSLNSGDVRRFQSSLVKLPFVPGYELTGEIIEVGKNVSDKGFNVGDRVAALNMELFGGLAQQCVVDISNVWKVPAKLSLNDGATILLGHSTALFTFSVLSQSNDKEPIIITAGSAGLGLAAVDVASNVYKRKVLAVTESEESGEITRSKGAFQTIHYQDNLKQKIDKLLGTKGVPFIYDAVGGKMMEEVDKCVSQYGRIYYAAPFTDKTVLTPPAHCSLTIVCLSQLKIQDPTTYRDIVQETIDMAEEEVISAHISEKFSLADINKALEFVNSNKCTGKVVIKIE